MKELIVKGQASLSDSNEKLTLVCVNNRD